MTNQVPDAPTTIYAVATGEYSDYAVHGAFVDRADAEDLVDRIGEAEVVELPLCAPGDRTSLTIRKKYHAEVSIRDGRIGEPQVYPYKVTEVIAVDVPTEADRVHLGSEETRVWATAATPDAAVKAARDKAADVLAQRHEETP